MQCQFYIVLGFVLQFALTNLTKTSPDQDIIIVRSKGGYFYQTGLTSKTFSETSSATHTSLEKSSEHTCIKQPHLYTSRAHLHSTTSPHFPQRGVSQNPLALLRGTHVCPDGGRSENGSLFKKAKEERGVKPGVCVESD